MYDSPKKHQAQPNKLTSQHRTVRVRLCVLVCHTAGGPPLGRNCFTNNQIPVLTLLLLWVAECMQIGANTSVDINEPTNYSCVWQWWVKGIQTDLQKTWKRMFLVICICICICIFVCFCHFKQLPTATKMRTHFTANRAVRKRTS